METEVVKDVWLCFKDQVFDLDPGFLLQFVKFVFRKVAVSEWNPFHFLAQVSLTAFHVCATGSHSLLDILDAGLCHNWRFDWVQFCVFNAFMLLFFKSHVFAQKELLVVGRVEEVHALLNLLTRHDRVVVHRLQQLRVLTSEVERELRAILAHELLALLTLDLPGVHGGLVRQGRLPH